MRHQYHIVVTVTIGLLLATVAKADYALTPSAGGLSSITVTPGSSLSLDLNLASSASDYTWSSIFTVDISQPGLKCLGHSWSSPYQTTGSDNRSAPTNTQTPTTLSAGIYVATSNDPGTVDVYFENFLDAGQFTTGKLLKLNLEVPTGFAAGAVTIRTLPISFDNGSSITTTGGTFTLNVQTGPTSRTSTFAAPAILHTAWSDTAMASLLPRRGLHVAEATCRHDWPATEGVDLVAQRALPPMPFVVAADAVTFSATFALAASIETITDERNHTKHKQSFHLLLHFG